MLKRRGIDISYVTVGRLLHEMKYSLRTNRKRLGKINDPDRDRQFRLLARRRNRFEREKWLIISLDCKKKELLGNFKNPGKTCQRDARDVLDHDFPSWADGRAIPFGIYDIARNQGFAIVGISRETSAFVINTIRCWWIAVGQRNYVGATRLAIECECGGGNGPRLWAWKAGLQRFADEFGLTITVGHFPPGASKWNLIEYRMSSLISANWAGEPLTGHFDLFPAFYSLARSESLFCMSLQPTPRGGTTITTASIPRSLSLPKTEMWVRTMRCVQSDTVKPK